MFRHKCSETNLFKDNTFLWKIEWWWYVFATNVSDPIENQLTGYLNFSNSGALPQFCQMLANACANQSAPQFYIMRQPKAKREPSRRKKEINCFQMVKIVGIWNNLSNFTRMLLKICTFHFYPLLPLQNT